MSEGFKDRLNRYTCQKCGGSIITRDEDHGVTPFMIACRAPDTKGCDGTMHSSFYSPSVQGEPTHIWRKPTPSEFAASSREMQEHYRMGGLNIYPVQS